MNPVPQEIERKFLLVGSLVAPFLNALDCDWASELHQGYLSVGQPEVRVGLKSWHNYRSGAGTPPPVETARLCVKYGTGLVRDELENDLDPVMARVVYERCEHRLRKTRYGAGRWEIDVYQGSLFGLVTAEIELTSAEEPLPDMPEWLREAIAKEVTGEEAYRNSFLATGNGRFDDLAANLRTPGNEPGK